MKRNYDFSKGVALKGGIKPKSKMDELWKTHQKTLTSIRLDDDIIKAAKKKANEEGVGLDNRFKNQKICKGWRKTSMSRGAFVFAHSRPLASKTPSRVNVLIQWYTKAARY